MFLGKKNSRSIVCLILKASGKLYILILCIKSKSFVWWLVKIEIMFITLISHISVSTLHLLHNLWNVTCKIHLIRIITFYFRIKKYIIYKHKFK